MFLLSSCAPGGIGLRIGPGPYRGSRPYYGPRPYYNPRPFYNPYYYRGNNSWGRPHHRGYYNRH